MPSINPAVCLIAIAGLALLSGQDKAPAPAAAPEPPATAKAPEYVGSETCQACHEDLYNGIAKSPHHTVDISKRAEWKGRACESCHGPGATHAGSASAADIRNPAKLTAALADKTCLSCHAGNTMHAARISGSHVKNLVSCVSCHKVHSTEPAGLVARKPEAINQQCASCHADIWAQFQKPLHHRVPEGAMTCVDCHNPHGGGRPALGQTFAANDAGCFKCHGDKRGPFTFEHAVVRFEGCGACHEPHGSANPRMLTRRQVSSVCLECHVNLPAQVAAGGNLAVVPPAFHDLRSPRFQNCTTCHQKVHGSHVDRNLLR
jgi:DmsE family decaheme c-type cytochrome